MRSRRCQDFVKPPSVFLMWELRDKTDGTLTCWLTHAPSDRCRLTILRGEVEITAEDFPTASAAGVKAATTAEVFLTGGWLDVTSKRARSRHRH